MSRHFSLIFEIENAEFDGSEPLHSALANVLKRVANDIDYGPLTGVIRDENGNRIGRYGIEE